MTTIILSKTFENIFQYMTRSICEILMSLRDSFWVYCVTRVARWEALLVCEHFTYNWFIFAIYTTNVKKV